MISCYLKHFIAVIFLMVCFTTSASEGYWQWSTGVNYTSVRVNESLDFDLPVPEFQSVGIGAIVGLSRYINLSERLDMGVGIEIQSIDGSELFIAKPINLSYGLNNDWRWDFSFGAGRYNYRLPAYGYVLATGFSYHAFGVNWQAKWQYGDHLARDKLHQDDPFINQDNMTTMRTLLVQISKAF